MQGSKKGMILDGFGEDIPPSLGNVKVYFNQKGLSEDAAKGFFLHYKVRKWKTKNGCLIRNWKVAATNWIWIYHQRKPININIR